VVQEGQARLELLVQVDRLPHVVRGAGEHPEVADDLAGPVGALADARDHRVEVLERVVDLELVAARVDPGPVGLRQRGLLVGREHGPQALDEVGEGGHVGGDEPDGVVELVGHAGDELADRGHLLSLDELELGGLEVTVGAPQLLVGGAQLLGADPHLVLEAPGEILDGLEARRAVDGEGHVAGHRGEQVHVALVEPLRLRRGDREHAEHLLAHAERRRHEALHPMCAAQRLVNRLGRALHVPDEHGLPGDRGPRARARSRLQGQLDALERGRRRVGPRGPVPAEHAALAVHQEEVGPLVRHPVDEPAQRLVVDLLRVERRAHRGAEVGEERQLLDPRLELDELLLELAVRVDDLLGLEIEQALGVTALVALAERVAQRDAGDERKGLRDQERPAPARGARDHPEDDRGGAADQGRRPEAGASRRVPPADVPSAGVGTAGRARALADPGARQPPVGGEALELHLQPRAAPDRDDLPGQGRPPKACPAAADVEGVEAVEVAGLLTVDRGHPLVGRAGAADPHGIGTEVRALLAGLPVHEGLPVAPRPALLVGLVHQRLADLDHLAGHRDGNPVVVGHEVVARPPRDAADRRDALRADLLLHEGDQRLREDAVDLPRHVGSAQLRLCTNVDVILTGLARLSATGDLRSIVSLHRRTCSSGAGLWMVTV
jgi:hypothetical protein